MHPAQHREHTEEHVIGNDDVGGKNLQGLLQALVLRWDGVDGCTGHSDGDVLLHALMDALLGAANLGDLGRHFPSDDPAFAGASSLGLLTRVGALIREAGFAVASLDATVIAQAPRLAPHIGAMRDAIAGALDIESGHVSVKATTNDGLGVVGSGEAIAALAIALLD